MNLKLIFGSCCGCLAIMIIISFVTLVGGFTAALSNIFGVGGNQTSEEIIKNNGMENSSDINISEEDLRQEIILASIITIPETEIILNLTGNTTEFGDFENDKTSPFGTVTVGNQIIPIDENGYVTTLAVNTGGSGEFIYLASFEKQNESYIMNDYKPLGDRVDVESLIVLDNQIIVSYKEHGPNQAMADKPNVTVTEVYTIDENYKFTK